MLPTYLPILVMLILAGIFGLVLILISFLLGRVKSSKTELMPYECGLDPADEPFKRVAIRYYVVALLFLLFDVETLFLYPVAAVFREKVASGWGLFVYGEMVLFLVILLVGYVYAYKGGALEWE